jgi:hypothetical protein
MTPKRISRATPAHRGGMSSVKKGRTSEGPRFPAALGCHDSGSMFQICIRVFQVPSLCFSRTFHRAAVGLSVAVLGCPVHAGGRTHRRPGEYGGRKSGNRDPRHRHRHPGGSNCGPLPAVQTDQECPILSASGQWDGAVHHQGPGGAARRDLGNRKWSGRGHHCPCQIAACTDRSGIVELSNSASGLSLQDA